LQVAGATHAGSMVKGSSGLHFPIDPGTVHERQAVARLRSQHTLSLQCSLAQALP
jgi:hypothetical protein